MHLTLNSYLQYKLFSFLSALLQFSTILANTIEPVIMGETSVRSNPIIVKHVDQLNEQMRARQQLLTQNKNSIPNNNPEIAEDLDSDYDFPLKIPDLPEDEYLELGEDAIPLSFLKRYTEAKMVSIISYIISLI